MRVGDYFELTDSAHLRLPEGRHFCVYAVSCPSARVADCRERRDLDVEHRSP